MEQLVADMRHLNTTVGRPAYETHAPRVEIIAMAYQRESARVNPAGRCLLLELPADIRNVLYEFVFSCEEEITLDLDHDGYQDQYQTQMQTLSALAMTCRKLRNECKDLPFWLNTFRLNAPVIIDLTKLPVMQETLPFPPQTPGAPRIQGRSMSPRSLARRARARLYFKLADTLPHIEEIALRLEVFIQQQHIISTMHKMHIFLGSQTMFTRVNRAWDRIGPILLKLSSHCEDVRVSFEIGASKRLMIAYEFSMGDPDTAVAEMDSCVWRARANIEPDEGGNGGAYDDFWPHELEQIDRLRTLIWRSMSRISGGGNDVSLPVPFAHPFKELDPEEQTRRSEETRERSLLWMAMYT